MPTYSNATFRLREPRRESCSRRRLTPLALGVSILGLALMFSTLSTPSKASAQDAAGATTTVSPEDNAAAEQLYRQGKALYDRGRFESAAKSFAEAYRLSQRGWVLYHVFLAYRQAHRDDLARDALSGYLALTRNVPSRNRLQLLLDRLEAELGPSRPFPSRNSSRATRQVARQNTPDSTRLAQRR